MMLCSPNIRARGGRDIAAEAYAHGIGAVFAKSLGQDTGQRRGLPGLLANFVPAPMNHDGLCIVHFVGGTVTRKTDCFVASKGAIESEAEVVATRWRP